MSTTDDPRLFGLGGRVAAVIGSASGIGEAVAGGLARQGAVVHCLDIDGDGAGATAAATGAAATAGIAAAAMIRPRNERRLLGALIGHRRSSAGLSPPNRRLGPRPSWRPE